jgi:hypothetical protein
MAVRLRFLAYSAEIYKRAKNLRGRELYDLFAEHGVWEYLYDCFDYLHTVGSQTTVEDIDRYIAQKK